MKKLFSTILFVAAALMLHAEVVWNDEPHNVGSWNAKQLPIANYAVLAKANEGDIIAITVSAVQTGARITLQNTAWQGMVDEYNVAVGVHPFVLTAAMAAEINTNGLIITGENYSFTKVELLYQTPLWVGTLDDTSSWTQSDALNGESLAALSAGSILGFEIAEIHESEWHSYALRANYETNPIEGWISNTQTALHILSEADVTNLQNKTIVLLARYLKITGFYTYSEHKYYVSGINSNWSTIAYPMTENEGVWSYTIPAASGWNEFKITRGTWEAGYNWGPSAIDNEASELALDEYNNNGNIHFNAYGEDITICWNPATAKVWVKVNNLDNLTATLAGTDALCGTGWDATDVNNDMLLQDGVFTWTKNGLYLNAKTDVEYKAVINHDWNSGAFGQGNDNCSYSFGVGYHDISITFTWKDKSLQITDVTYPKMMLAGTFNPTWDGEELVYSHDDNKYSITKTIANAGVYAFKLIENATWRTDQYSAQMDRTNCTDWSFSYSNDANNTLLIDLPGDYTFTYTYEGKLLSITGFPTSFSRPASANYGSLCVPFDAELTNGRAFEITSREGDVVTITEPENIVAGHAYIIKAIDPAQPILISKKAEGDTVAAPIHDAYHYGVLGNTVTVTASYEAYVLMDNELRKVEDEGEVTVASTKAYFKLPASSLAPSALRIVEAENTSTAIENIDANQVAVKFVENGKLYILREGVVYDVTGKVVR